MVEVSEVGRRGFLTGVGLAAGAVAGLVATASPAHATEVFTPEEQEEKNTQSKAKVFLGRIFHLLTNPDDDKSVPSPHWQLLDHGALVINKDGKIDWVGDRAALPRKYRWAKKVDYRHERFLITPGLIDSHVHSTQIDAIAFGGLQLLPWLQNFVFPAEDKFKDPIHAKRYSNFFVNLLLSNGTTSATVHTTMHKTAADELFKITHKHNMRMNIGKVLMDEAFNEPLRDPSVGAAEQVMLQLLEEWHGKGRQSVVITPRFALSCTPEMLQMAGKLYNGGMAAAGVKTAGEKRMFMQTHFAENITEIKQTQAAFGTTYLGVYEKFGLVGPRCNFHHANHLSVKDQQSLKASGSGLSHCPDSNGHLGSGWFDLHSNSKDWRIKVGLGTDCGAGTNYSLLQTMHDGYKTCILRENAWDWAMLFEPPTPAHPNDPPDRPLQPKPTDHFPPGSGNVRGKMDYTAFQAFWLATMGSAEVLGHEDKIGNFTPGKEGDFVVWDTWSTPVLKQRWMMQDPKTGGPLQFDQRLFGFMMMGGANYPAHATYIMGKKLYDKEIWSQRRRSGFELFDQEAGELED